LKNRDIRWIQRFDSFGKAMRQLTKFIEKGELNELEEQGLIQSFEYTHDLAWKTLKDFLEDKGIKDIYGSRDSTREAFRLGLLENGEVWMEMIKSRNLTSHTYNEETAREIATDVFEKYYHEFLKLQEKFQKLVEKEK
jgi:nucleotidyltransferase substrate binding protein (TIGR01987 family)